MAAGAATFALGTDTGGSIRVPAALNGIVGFKPAYGLVPRHGVTSLSWSLDHVGPVTRTVEDAALVMTVLAGHDPRDPASLDTPAVDHRPEREPETLGARLVEIDIPMTRYIQATQWGLMVPEATAYHEGTLGTVPELYQADGPGAAVEPGRPLNAIAVLQGGVLSRKPMVRPGGRSARVQASVHAAVREILSERGRDSVTVPLVAQRAGVTPSTIYRRWGDLQELLSDVAVERLRPDTAGEPRRPAVRPDGPGPNSSSTRWRPPPAAPTSVTLCSATRTAATPVSARPTRPNRSTSCSPARSAARRAHPTSRRRWTAWSPPSCTASSSARPDSTPRTPAGS